MRQWAYCAMYMRNCDFGPAWALLVQGYRLNLRVGSCECWHMQRPLMAVALEVSQINQIAAGHCTV